MSPIGNDSSQQNGSNWVELSTELLMKIFSHLKLDELGLKDYQDNKHCLLQTRLVHPRWKLVMDELLEKWCLEFWTKWKATYPSNVSNRYNFPHLSIGRSLDGSGMDDILCPPFLQEENRPSPTKSVCITERKKSKYWKREIYFPKYGTTLTSLTLNQISAKNPLPAKTLASVLNFTSNLKAIAIQNVCFQGDGVELQSMSLPALPHLEHLKFWGVKEIFVDWILKPYSKQLVTLETDRCIEWNPNDNDFLAYQSLKRLKVWPPLTGLVEAPVIPPPLQFLSLGGLKTGDVGPNTLQLIQKCISHFSATLVDLHLEVSNYLTSRPRVYASVKSEGGDKDEDAVGPPITNFSFPMLKTFWIFYPKTEGEVGIVTDFLQMFPALETLKLLLDSEDIDGHTAKEHLMEQEFWKVCPNLKTISVQIGGYVDNLILRMEAPFN
ncbi:hypothetical protein Ocin01_16155 [Orchesella cincta]|uniref:F-box domain-containing protein n=1 Tax=Orchesella cincta TaxID=48709 RepID=A0A1D2MC01_ORCCI|nr:hypothetical protein Ocin01_16155 [Orchesella cincta]